MLAGLSLACGAAPTSPEMTETCTGYADWTTSAYVLPYPAGQTYRVSQGNCSPPGNGHRGSERYSYDFEMAIGTPIAASRAGVVVHVESSHVDGQIAVTGLDNYVVIRHGDGTHALYGHLTHDGADVREGDAVGQGQIIGRSGNTGNTNNCPHLHLSVHTCDPVTLGSAACVTQPITFRNTEANPSGLLLNRRYTALPF
jgi:murein DD-endopeptidase MepM/ murein hydrolase activator NlpD